MAQECTKPRKNHGAIMTSASAGHYQSPLQKLQQELQSEVSDGAISSSDGADGTTSSSGSSDFSALLIDYKS